MSSELLLVLSCTQRLQKRGLSLCVCSLWLALDIGVSFLLYFEQLDSEKFIAGHYSVPETGDST